VGTPATGKNGGVPPCFPKQASFPGGGGRIIFGGPSYFFFLFFQGPPAGGTKNCGGGPVVLPEPAKNVLWLGVPPFCRGGPEGYIPCCGSFCRGGGPNGGGGAAGVLGCHFFFGCLATVEEALSGCGKTCPYGGPLGPPWRGSSPNQGIFFNDWGLVFPGANLLFWLNMGVPFF